MFRCIDCGSNALQSHTTLWCCGNCGCTFQCVEGIPRLYRDERLGAQDRAMQAVFYGGAFGRCYQWLMPFLLMPVRPWPLAKWAWAAYGIALSVIAVIVIGAIAALADASAGTIGAAGLGWILLLALLALISARQRQIAWLLLLAIPVKIALVFTRFRPEEEFGALHRRIVAALAGRGTRLRILDVATGNCHSLYRHGWMQLDADYVAVDLSAAMIVRGAQFMTQKGVTVDFALADAAQLPFVADSFDVVLNYGAINGLTDPGAALREMARVAKSDGLVLFLDEQLHREASILERLYFEKVVSSHNVVHSCPVHLMPPDLVDVEVKQVYHFYYICTARKAARAAN